MNLEGRRPKIDYPCRWQYRVIGKREKAVRSAIAAAVDGRDHEASLSRRSTKGKYLSLSLEVEVESEEDRNRIYRHLVEHPATDYVL